MNDSQTIPLSELGQLDETEHSELSSDDVFSILSAKVRRGRVICVVLFILAFAGIIVAVAFYHSTPWAIVSGTGSIAFRVWALLSHRKIELAHRIAVEPRLVYWAHPRRSTIRGYEVLLTLHTRTGQSLEVAMSREQMLDVVAWLRRHNRDIRCGAYDDRSESPNEDA